MGIRCADVRCGYDKIDLLYELMVDGKNPTAREFPPRDRVTDSGHFYEPRNVEQLQSFKSPRSLCLEAIKCNNASGVLLLSTFWSVSNGSDTLATSNSGHHTILGPRVLGIAHMTTPRDKLECFD